MKKSPLLLISVIIAITIIALIFLRPSSTSEQPLTKEQMEAKLQELNDLYERKAAEDCDVSTINPLFQQGMDAYGKSDYTTVEKLAGQAEEGLKSCTTFPGGETTASQSIVVDVSKTSGPIRHIATGFLAKPSNESYPSKEIYEGIKPASARLTAYNVSSVKMGLVYDRLKSQGVKIQIVITGTGHGFIFGNISNYTFDYPFDGFGEWNELVTTLVSAAKNNSWDIEWDIWNEPNNHCDWTPNDINCYWPKKATKEQFYETWKKTYRLIRSLDPDAVIAGPSTSAFGGFIVDFLKYCKANDVVPDILSWHEFPSQDREIAQIYDHVETIREYIKANDLGITKISINEYGPLNCGYQLCTVKDEMFNRADKSILYMYYLEKAEVDSAMRSTIMEFNVWGRNDTLNNLITPDQKPRTNWFAYKFYSDMTGRLLDLDSVFNSTNGLSAIAAVDNANGTVSMLMGRTGNEKPANLTFNGLDSVFGDAGQLNLTVYYVARSELSEATKELLFSGVKDSVDGSLSYTIPVGGLGDIYFITISQ